MTSARFDRRGLLLPWLLMAGLIPACGRERPGHDPAAGGASGPVAVVAHVAQATSTVPTEVPGTVEALRSAILASRIAAAVEKVTVEEGSRFRRGDLLVRLDSRDIAARIRAGRASLTAARAHRDRIRMLLVKEAATRQELEVAEAQDAAAEAALEAEQSQIAYAEIRAPFQGVVTRRMIHPGDTAAPGSPMLALQADGPLRIAASVTEEQAAHLAQGQSLEAELEDGRRVRATVSILGPASDPASRRFLIKADLPDDSGARAGGYARLIVPGPQAAPLALAPRSALIERGALTGLFVIEAGHARLRWVRPGAAQGDAVVVRAGLRPGETIVLNPEGLADGDAVVPSAAGAIP